MSAMMSHLNRDLTSFSYYESPQQSEPALIAAEETTVMNVKEYSFVPVTDMLDCLDYRTRCKLLVEAAAAHPPDGIHHPPPPPPQSAETTARPAKRARTDGGESAPPPTAYSPDQLTEMLTSLTPAARAKLLIEAAASSPTTAGKIAFAHNAKVKRDAAKPARDAAKPQDFWPLYLKAMDQMLVRHEHLSQPRQRTKGFDLAFAIDKMLATIVSKTRPESSWETKFSAVFTVREIFSMMDENGMIPRVVRQNCLDWGPKLVAVVKTCDEEELGRLRAASVKPAEGKTDLFINHFEQMVRMTEAYCIEDYLCTKEAWGLLIAGRRNGGEGEAGGAGIVPGAGTCTADSGEAAGDAAGGTAVGITCTGRISTGGGRGPDCLTSYQTFMGPCKRQPSQGTLHRLPLPMLIRVIPLLISDESIHRCGPQRRRRHPRTFPPPPFPGLLPHPHHLHHRRVQRRPGGVREPLVVHWRAVTTGGGATLSPPRPGRGKGIRRPVAAVARPGRRPGVVVAVCRAVAVVGWPATAGGRGR